MAYYNDVRILMSKEAFDVFKGSVEFECAVKDINNPLDELDVKIVNKELDVVYFGWDDVKWFNVCYDAFSVIKSTLDFIKVRGYSYRFSRIGEDYDDIEEVVEDGELDGDLDYIQIIRKFDDKIFMNEEGK